MKNLPGLPDLTIGSIFCMGRNYQKHAQELGSSVPDEPMVFLKPAGSLIGDRESILLPKQSKEVHHEVELVIAIGKQGKNIPEQDALGYVAGYGIGIDVTARDIQQKEKENRHPWSVAKGFDTFAPISSFIPVKPGTDFDSMDLSLEVNGNMRQKGNTVDMIFPVTTLISYLSTIFTLNPGDLIFTGTPEGVSPIKSGDSIQATLNKNEITLTISVQ